MIIQYVVIFFTMLAGAFSGVYLGLLSAIASLNDNNEVYDEFCVEEFSDVTTPIVSDAASDLPNEASLKIPPKEAQNKGEEIRKQMKKQDDRYCFLQQEVQSDAQEEKAVSQSLEPDV